MKRVLGGVGFALGVFLLLGVVTGTSLVGEVVELHTKDADGAWHTTPLWIVESDGLEYLRAGQPGADWLARVRANPDAVRLERNGTLREVRLTEEVSERDRINRDMHDRYGWADTYVGLFRSPEEAVPLRVEDMPSAPAAP